MKVRTRKRSGPEGAFYHREKDGYTYTIYHGECQAVIEKYELKRKFHSILTDPPYGVGLRTKYYSIGRGKMADCIDYPEVHGDSKPFNPWWMIQLGVPCLLWGANFYTIDGLPNQSGWVVWDKKRPHDIDQAHCELAWSNYVKGVRIFRHTWNGFMRASEKGENYHPTQKPVALWEWVLNLKWKPPGRILDPYMGAGPLPVACVYQNRSVIGIEVSKRYCEIAAERIDVAIGAKGSPMQGSRNWKL